MSTFSIYQKFDQENCKMEDIGPSKDKGVPGLEGDLVMSLVLGFHIGKATQFV